VPQARGRGLARRILAELEATAAAAGRVRMVLETGTLQPEAIALYSSCGYTPIPKFGLYREDPLSVCLGKPLADGA
jgi:GNAT superfamily N-acetyltransferase